MRASELAGSWSCTYSILSLASPCELGKPPYCRWISSFSVFRPHALLLFKRFHLKRMVFINEPIWNTRRAFGHPCLLNTALSIASLLALLSALLSASNHRLRLGSLLHKISTHSYGARTASPVTRPIISNQRRIFHCDIQNCTSTTWPSVFTDTQSKAMSVVTHVSTLQTAL